MAGAYLWRRDRRALDARLLVAVGVFGAALIPTVLFRPDAFHIRLVVSIGVALVALYPVLNEIDTAYRLVRGGRGVRTATRDFFNDERARQPARS